MPIYATGKKKDGKNQYRVIVSHTDAYGKHKQHERTAYGKAEAQELEAALKAELKQASAPEHMTVGQLYEEYMEQKRQEVRVTTYEKTRRNLEYAVLPEFADAPLKRLNTQMMQKWKNAIGARDLKASTKKNYYKEFSALLNYAVKREYIVKNPLKLVENFRTTEFSHPEEMLYYTPEEYKKYAAAALQIAENSAESKAFANWAYYVFFSIAFYTGMRKGEINALKWENIDGTVIKVRESVSQKVKGGYREGDPKTASSIRDIVMPEPLCRIVEAHRARQQRDSRFAESHYVCGGTKCLPDATIENRNTRYCEAAGVKHIRIHDFRHTHASLLINEGINIMEVSRRLGHRDIKETLKTYSHLYPREEDKAVAVLNRIL